MFVFDSADLLVQQVSTADQQVEFIIDYFF